MQLIIVTGLSGGGKSIAIRQLEDSGFYCIDNLPAEFLLPIAENLEKTAHELQQSLLMPARMQPLRMPLRHSKRLVSAASMSAYFFSQLPMKSFCGDSLKLAADILEHISRTSGTRTHPE